MPQAETPASLTRLGTELAENPTTMVQINFDPDSSKVPVSNPQIVGTPVKVTHSE